MDTTVEALKKLNIALGYDGTGGVNTTVEALKNTYVALGGDADYVADISRIPDIIEAITSVANKEIADDWETIVSNIANGTTKYVVGQYKPLNLGEHGIVNMQIVAKGANASPLADGNGNASYDFVAKETLKTSQKLSSDSNYSGGWENSDLRQYLKESIKPLIPTTIRNAIKEVAKVSYVNTPSAGDVLTADDLWIPSYREIFGGESFESSGTTYKDIYKDNISRAMTAAGGTSSIDWWLRSGTKMNVPGTTAYYVTVNGTGNYGGPTTSHYVALGFSL